MNEGWSGDDYLILFADSEISAVSEAYDIQALLPGYQIVGLRGWDDFIVRDANGDLFSVPTVPCIPKYLEPYELPSRMIELETDVRFAGKIKWYVKPILFGGDPSASENIQWVTRDVHARSVQWWNQLYRDLSMSRTH